jgi:hypothetical protein
MKKIWRWLYGDSIMLTLDTDNAVLAEIAKLRYELVQYDEWNRARTDLILARITATTPKRPIAVVPELEDFEAAQRSNLATLENLNGPFNQRR